MWAWLKQKDIDLNEWLGGKKGETISSRLGRKIENDNCWTCRIFCRVWLLPLSVALWLKGDKFTFKHCRDYIQDEFR